MLPPLQNILFSKNFQLNAFKNLGIKRKRLNITYSKKNLFGRAATCAKKGTKKFANIFGIFSLPNLNIELYKQNAKLFY